MENRYLNMIFLLIISVMLVVPLGSAQYVYANSDGSFTVKERTGGHTILQESLTGHEVGCFTEGMCDGNPSVNPVGTSEEVIMLEWENYFDKKKGVSLPKILFILSIILLVLILITLAVKRK